MKKINSFVLLCFLLVSIPHFSQNSSVEVKTLLKDFSGNGSITIDAEGKIYINEYGTANSDISGTGKHIYVISPEGKPTILSKEVSGAVGNTLAPNGTYYFNNGNSFYKSDLMSYKDGKMKKIATLEGFSGDILLDSQNDFFLIPSYTHPVLRKVSMDGIVEDYIEDERLKGVTGITYGEKNIIFVSNFTTGKIYKIDNNQSISELATLPVVYPGYVIGYITYFEGHIYGTGYGSNKIYQVDMNGKVEVLAGSGEYNEKDGSALEAGFITPNGIEIDAKRRRLYISQNGNGRPASLRYIDLPKS
ncbi:hypothetical protein [Flagellimonas meridianipacifica]|uniref:SMP-30/gluconolaconase/LRE-like protein n=1 Tax=Flagellimonas meridianipacifica TaxID=1080225 RepID=A0A2T0MG05_9FLAO|nr:hypothetical protein [Allomuricauda pacifica]PRX56503.1 hypothetical protein CLV81_0500 [Allomuricauda pacifica]